MDIVLVSMTRSNKLHDIGFMAEPERVNVLLSRARDGLIMIGNSDTFMTARKGKEVWRKLFDHLSQKEHIYDGFPVKCEKHPIRIATLSSPEDFESECPDGGCKEPWYVEKSGNTDNSGSADTCQWRNAQLRPAQMPKPLPSALQPLQNCLHFCIVAEVFRRPQNVMAMS
jgi:hypothetical protein